MDCVLARKVRPGSKLWFVRKARGLRARAVCQGRSLFADPKQTGDGEIDLLDQCQVLVPFGVLDFIDADGVDLAKRPVFQTPGDQSSTASKTLSEEVRKDLAVSFHDSRRAQRARNST